MSSGMTAVPCPYRCGKVFMDASKMAKHMKTCTNKPKKQKEYRVKKKDRE